MKTGLKTKYTTKTQRSLVYLDRQVCDRDRYINERARGCHAKNKEGASTKQLEQNNLSKTLQRKAMRRRGPY